MCVIAASPAGAPQPTESELRAMFARNPHGAGYMYARAGKVHIHKGFMDCTDYLRTIRNEHFTADDPVVYHCRIATQGTIGPAMTQPFPLSANLKHTTKTDLICPIGLAHNGIISLTSDPAETDFSDTALFISRFAVRLLRSPRDLHDPQILDAIELLTRSKWAILAGDGSIETVGNFTKCNGILYSNTYHQPIRAPRYYMAKRNFPAAAYSFD